MADTPKRPKAIGTSLAIVPSSFINLLDKSISMRRCRFAVNNAARNELVLESENNEVKLVLRSDGTYAVYVEV